MEPKETMKGAQHSVPATLGHYGLKAMVWPVNNVEHHKGKREEDAAPLINLRNVVRVKDLRTKPFSAGVPRAWGATIIRF